MEKFDSILPSEISIHDGHHQRLKIDKLMPASRHFVWPKTTIVVILRFTGTLNCVHNFLLDIIWMVSFAAKIWRYWKLLLCHKRCHKRCTIRFLPFPPPFSLSRLIFLFLHLSLSLSLSLIKWWNYNLSKRGTPDDWKWFLCIQLLLLLLIKSDHESEQKHRHLIWFRSVKRSYPSDRRRLVDNVNTF